MKTSYPFSRTIPLFLAAYFLLTFCGSALKAAELKRLNGHVPAAVATAPDLGPLDGNQTLQLTLGLSLRNEEALGAFLKALYDPHSPGYGHYLAAKQFGALYGASSVDYQAVIDFAKVHHLKVQATYVSHFLVAVSGRASDIQKAFHLELHSFQRHDGSSFYAPTGEPSVERNLALSHVSGLDNSIPTHRHPPQVVPASRRAKVGNDASIHGLGPYGTYLPSDLKQAYAPGVSLDGAGQSLALYEMDGFYPADIQAFENQTGLSVSVVPVLVAGYDGDPVRDPFPADVEEVELDIEMGMALAPGLSRILVYEGQDKTTAPNAVFAQIAEDDLAAQVSCSWTPNPDAITDAILKQMAAQGQSCFESSGDDGGYSPPIDPSFIEDSPYMTVVGGTQLLTNGGGAYYASGASEVTWPGSGGGQSLDMFIPSYQVGSLVPGSGASSTKRNLPDVSMAANNLFAVMTFFDPSGAIIPQMDVSGGGTSASAPLWASFMALVNEQRQHNGLGPLGFANPALYAVAQSGDYANAFHDITSGNNFVFNAGPGYDLVTGLGSPAGQPLINDLCPACAPAPLLPTPTATWTPVLTFTSTLTPTNSLTPTITWTPTNTATSTATCDGGGTAGAIGTSLAAITITSGSTAAVRVYVPQDSMITSLTVYGSLAGLPRELGVYDDDGLGAHPTTLIGSVTYTDADHVFQTLPVSLKVSAGYKWLAITADPSPFLQSTYFIWSNPSGEGSVPSVSFSGRMPANAIGSSPLKVQPLSLQASYCPIQPVCLPSGASWSQAPQTAPFTPRSSFGSAVHHGKMWIVGGTTGLGDRQVDNNDIWNSTDGKTWTQANVSGGMPPREDFTLLSYDLQDGYGERLFLIGGDDPYGPDPNAVFNDVWETYPPAGDINFLQVTANANFPSRRGPACVVFNNLMWMMGGAGSDDVWSSKNGKDWGLNVSHVPGFLEIVHNAAVLNGQIYAISQRGVSQTGPNLVWSSPNGNQWNPVPITAGFPPRDNFAFLSFGGRLWVIGGSNLTQRFNDVWWSTDGANWSKGTAKAPFSPRTLDQGVLAFENQLWVLGGLGNGINGGPSNPLNDVWSSFCFLRSGNGVQGSLLGNIIRQLLHLIELKAGLTNGGDTSLDLTQVEMRYWFKSDCAGNPLVLAKVEGREGEELVKSSSGSLAPGSPIRYLSFQFKSGSLAPGQSLTLDAAADFTRDIFTGCGLSAVPAGTQLTVYVGGQLVSGQEPSSVPTMTFSPTVTPTATMTASASPTPTCPFASSVFVPCAPTPTPTAGILTAADRVEGRDFPTLTVTPSPTATLVLPVAGAFPNFSRGGAPILFKVDADAGSLVQLDLYSLVGEEVLRTSFPGDGRGYSWDLKNQSGSPVASGLYIYVLRFKEQGQDVVYKDKVSILH